MNEYKFEYSDQKFVTKLFIICFGIFIISFASTIGISKVINLPSKFFITLFMLLCFGIPFTYFWLNRKKIKKIGSAKLNDNNVEIEIENNEKKINFEQIENYSVQVYNGTLLQIKLLNGEIFKISSNSNFCNTMDFDKFTRDLEIKIQDFREKNNSKIIRKKTFFERAWVYPFLVTMTIIIVIFVIYSIYKGRDISIKLIPAIAPLISFWAAYYSAKNRIKKE